MITENELYSLLPEGQFNIESTMNLIRDYSPYQRFPHPKFELYEVLSVWYNLVRSGKVIVDDTGFARKIDSNEQDQLNQTEGLLRSPILEEV